MIMSNLQPHSTITTDSDIQATANSPIQVSDTTPFVNIAMAMLPATAPVIAVFKNF